MPAVSTVHVITWGTAGGAPEIAELAGTPDQHPDNLVREILGSEFTKLPYPAALQKADLVICRAGGDVVVAERDDQGEILSVCDARTDEIVHDLLGNKELFLPYFSISPGDLATWIEQQDEDCWWSVDGDPLLMGRLHMPCPGDELSAELRSIDKVLFLLDKELSVSTAGQWKSAEALDDLATTDEYGFRLFQFCWRDRPENDWILFEDEETSDSSSGP